MKHTLKVTLILISLFLIAQFIGLVTVNRYIQVETDEEGAISIIHEDTVVGEQPSLKDEEKSYTFIVLILMVLIGTALLFVLIRFNLGRVWKFWFIFAIAMALSISFGVYVPSMIALGMGLILSILRVWKPNPVIHNFTEVFVYTGITILILPLLNLFSATLLLILISVYDMFAVWKSKHMIKLAEFQIKSRSFAGLSMNYEKGLPKSKGAKAGKKGELKNAILGGGDIAFPLLFAAAVMEWLILGGFSKMSALGYASIVSAGAGSALVGLLTLAKQDRFYPAMPFISMGCFAGFLVLLVIL